MTTWERHLSLRLVAEHHQPESVGPPAGPPQMGGRVGRIGE